jgi:hypothetical protein
MTRSVLPRTCLVLSFAAATLSSVPARGDEAQEQRNEPVEPEPAPRPAPSPWFAEAMTGVGWISLEPWFGNAAGDSPLPAADAAAGVVELRGGLRAGSFAFGPRAAFALSGDYNLMRVGALARHEIRWSTWTTDLEARGGFAWLTSLRQGELAITPDRISVHGPTVGLAAGARRSVGPVAIGVELGVDLLLLTVRVGDDPYEAHALGAAFTLGATLSFD